MEKLFLKFGYKRLHHLTNLQMSREPNCRTKCKNVTWFDHSFKRRANVYFTRFGSQGPNNCEMGPSRHVHRAAVPTDRSSDATSIIVVGQLFLASSNKHCFANLKMKYVIYLTMVCENFVMLFFYFYFQSQILSMSSGRPHYFFIS